MASHDQRMRALCLAVALVMGGCQPSGQHQRAERIEIRQSGSSSVDIAITSDGSGSYTKTNGGAPAPLNGVFRITPVDFRKLEAQLAEFRGASVPRSDASIREMVDFVCPEGVPYVTDRGAIYVRWIGKGFDQHYGASLECDPERNARRNSKLLELVRNVPASAA